MGILRKFVAYLMLFLMWGNLEVSLAQTSGLPAPSSSPIVNAAAAEALFANLTGCGTSSYVFTPAAGDCVAQSGSGLGDPGSDGVVVRTALNTTTAVAAPSGTIVGTTDTQTLTNKTLDGVTPTTMGYVDPTSSIQTQLNGKASIGANSTITSLTGLTTPINIVASSETVSFSATPTFSITTRYSTVTMTAAITSFTLASGTAGQEKTLTFCENGTGGYAVTAPSNVHGFMNITSSATASKCNSQHFNYDTAQSAWLADGPGIINE